MENLIRKLTIFCARFISAIPYILDTRNVETIPYTNQSRCIIPKIAVERSFGESGFEEFKHNWKGNTMVPTRNDNCNCSNIGRIYLKLNMKICSTIATLATI